LEQGDSGIACIGDGVQPQQAARMPGRTCARERIERDCAEGSTETAEIHASVGRVMDARCEAPPAHAGGGDGCANAICQANQAPDSEGNSPSAWRRFGRLQHVLTSRRYNRSDGSKQIYSGLAIGFQEPVPPSPSGATMKLRPPSYLMLGMVRLGAKSGYAIKKATDVSTRVFWPTSLAQVYPELAR